MIELWDHQKRAIAAAKKRAEFGEGLALWLEQGTGKTRCVIEILQHLFSSPKSGSRLLKTVIFCPLIAIDNWVNEFKKYSTISEHYLLPLKGSQVDRQRLFFKAKTELGSFIVIANYEALVMYGLFSDFLSWHPEVLVWDESQRISSLAAKRTKHAVKLAQGARLSYLLSGTPAPNSALDLFSQYLAMDKGKSFGANFYQFRARYFYDKNAGMPSHLHFPNWQVRPGATEEINQIVNRTSIRVKKEECLDLPPLIRQTYNVELSSDQAKAYRELHKDFITYIGDKACVAQIALTKALRLQQVVSGFLKMEDGSIVRFDNPRLKALEELLVDLVVDHKVIIWAVFIENYKDLRAVCEKNKIKYVECTGDVNEKDKLEAPRLFQEDKSVRVFLAHPRSAGLAINLTQSDVSIYYSRDFSLENDLQSQARNHRGGSEIHQKITRIDLVSPGTIDELVLTRLSQKEQMGESLIQAIKQYEPKTT